MKNKIDFIEIACEKLGITTKELIDDAGKTTKQVSEIVALMKEGYEMGVSETLESVERRTANIRQTMKDIKALENIKLNKAG